MKKRLGKLMVLIGGFALILLLANSVVVAQDSELGLGVYTWDTPYDSLEGASAFQNTVGANMQYLLWFQAFGDSDAVFQTEAVLAASERGWIPIISLEPWARAFDDRQTPQPEYSYASITAGNHDEYFHQWAQAAAAANVPIIVRFAQDQSLPAGQTKWYPWQGAARADATDFVAAYRHIIEIFREDQANKVKFMWSAIYLDREDTWLYYPGEQWIDVIGLPVLNYGTLPEWSQWYSFEQLFDAQYAEIVSRTQSPIIITQFGSAEQGGNKGDWLSQALTRINTDYQNVVGVIFWEIESDPTEPLINWSVSSTPAALEGLRQALGQIFAQ